MYKSDKRTYLFIILGAFFITNAIVAEFIGAKIFSLEQSLGLDKMDFSILGFEHLSFELTCGVIIWPIVFIMTDIINEYYGKKGIRLLSILTAILISYAFILVFMAMHTTPAGWWVLSGVDKGIPDMQFAYKSIFGQGLWIIIGSIVAFLIGQMIDVWVFHFLKSRSGNKNLWLRSTGSTLVSQMIDSFIVLFIAFYIGNNWSMKQVLAIGLMNYIYKFTVAIILTPLLYVVHNWVDRFLGKDLSERMMKEAQNQQ